MTTVDELRASVRTKYKSDFDFIPVDEVPFTAPSKPLSRVALITTAGLHLDDQPPFDLDTQDCSYRRIRPTDDLSRLRVGWDAPARQDVNCAFPLALLREMSGVAETHYSFSGAIPDPRPLVDDTAPEVAREIDADAVILAPS